MLRTLLTVLATLIVVALGVAVYMGLSLYKPEVIHRDLTREFAITGLTIGVATPADMIARFGPPATERKAVVDTVYTYPAKGLLFRFDNASGTLSWYEIGSTAYATGQGIRVGDDLTAIRGAYGNPEDQSLVDGALHLRYTYGTRYALEFWLNTETARVERIVFFRA